MGRQVNEKYVDTGKARFVYRHMAFLGQESQWSSEAAECAGEQGKFWEYHDKLFTSQKGENQGAFSKDNLKKFAADIKLNTTQFNQCLDTGKFSAKVQQSNQNAQQLGIPGTPTVFINGIYIPGQYLDALDTLVAWQMWLNSNPKQYAAPDKAITPGKKYTATFKTAKGDFAVELFADRTPNSVNAFVFLAKTKYYDGVTFHRVLTDAGGMIAQAGDPSGTGLGNPGFQCNDEIIPNLTFSEPGLLAMANSGPNTNGSQFFITLAARPDLNGKHAVFGKVISGMDVVKKLMPRDPQENPSAPPGDVIQTIVIEES